MVHQPLLLATKLQAPPVHGEPIARVRLLGRLDQARRLPVTVIAAPPGFGKTTLLADWCRHAGLPTAWLSLDEGDNDPTHFWRYVVAALERVRAGIGQSVSPLLSSPRPPLIETVLTIVLNDLAGVARDCALVLDDYHVISTPAIHRAVAFLVDHLPAHMHLLITSRADPPLPLARWRARGLLVELRTADLGFRTEEAATFLARSLGTRLTAEQVAQLVARTEGWATGLQLAALLLAHHDDVAGFIGALRGTQRFILDYLSDEVLNRQDERVQSFLVQTSVLERLHGPLCDAVTGYSDSQKVLDELERANLFVVALDEEPRWFRYHQLFAEFLRGRLQEQHPQLVGELHRRAARWHAQHALHGAAIGHWLAAPDMEEAAGLIERVGQERLMGGELTTLQGWLDRLPEPIVAARPRLCLLQAWAHVFGWRGGDVERALRQAEAGTVTLPEPERAVLLGEVEAARETAALFHADLARFQSLHAQVPGDHQGLADDSSFLHGVRHLNLAFALEWKGDSAAAAAAYQEVSDRSQASGNVVVAVLALSQLADQLVARGRLRQAAETHRRALQLVSDRRPGLEVAAAMPHLGLALVDIERYDLLSAAGHVDATMELARRVAHPLLQSGAALALARLKQAEGDYAAAQAALDRADQHGSDTGLEPFLAAYTNALRVRLHVAAGELPVVAGWLEHRPSRGAEKTSTVADVALLDALDQTTFVLALIALGRPREALDQIGALYRRFAAAQLDGVLVELLILSAMAHDALGEEAEALGDAARSLALAVPEGFVWVYLEKGSSVARLLERLDRFRSASARPAQEAIPSAYLHRLLAAIDDSRGAPVPTAAPTEQRPRASSPVARLVEPLSEREREVLRLVAAGHSNQAIAAALVVEVSTVKTHLLRLYAKLGVHSRTQAIAKARALHLLL